MLGEASPGVFRLIVAPGVGRLRLLPPRRFEAGHEVVEAGQPLARVELPGTDVVLRSPIAGRVSAVIGLEGQPVTRGTVVMSIDPHEA